MKRKIAAILAADIAGYSRLVAEDEEETLRRLATCRAVFADFVERGSGRIFNTAGDAILADFPSAVDAVRCAIDVQESLRTRNLAYPPSRQMSFRIGITIGDVVEREGDLLGDGVNIAARLEALAPAGGLCVSRTVYEQVANKLSVEFADIGEQAVKNIPTPVHAFALALGSDKALPVLPKGKKAGQNHPWVALTSIGAATVGVVVIAAIAYVLTLEARRSGTSVASVSNPVAPPPPEQRRAEPLIPEIVPRIADRARIVIRDRYVPAPDHKALAISDVRMGFISGQADEETAKRGALETCRKNSDPLGPGHTCEVYAVGDTVVYQRGRAPMPPQPWVTSDPSIERPLVLADLPLVSEQFKQRSGFLTTKKSKAWAVASGGASYVEYGQTSPDEAVRRALENCGFYVGAPCLIIVVDDVIVVPVPTTMKAVGLFTTKRNEIAPELRDSIALRLAGARTGWSAVAVGASGRAGLALKAVNEQDAVTRAMADCAKQDRNCRIMAIGPFSVEPK